MNIEPVKKKFQSLIVDYMPDWQYFILVWNFRLTIKTTLPVWRFDIFHWIVLS